MGWPCEEEPHAYKPVVSTKSPDGSCVLLKRTCGICATSQIDMVKIATGERLERRFVYPQAPQ